MLPTDPPLELRNVSEKNLRESVWSMSGYLKFASMIWIRALHQPIPDGVIVKAWSRDAHHALKDFCDRHSCDEVLLRVDARNKRWSERRGGYIIPRSKAREVTRELTNESKIAAFLEPLSPYCDRYSLAAITDVAQQTMTIEVVGPGFDASDLLRSDSLPHERFDIVVPRLSQQRLKLSVGRQTYVIRPPDYRHTVEERFVKIGARLRNPAYPKAIIKSTGVQRTCLAEEAINYLERTKQAALLRHAHEYKPISKQFVARFASGIGSIIDGLNSYHVQLGSTSFAGTFTSRGRFVFWDFFPADLAKAKELYLRP